MLYRLATNTSIFASYSNSFSVNSGTDIYFNALTPSIINHFEVGIKNDFFKEPLSANVTIYRIKNNNLEDNAPTTSEAIQS
ncbi:MAG: TonB-dependent receptor [Bacteroidota bacterium]|nr:TonB-dependent receptor [Bacteroidota bacterium]